MATVRVNIADFMSKYATAGVPEDVWRTLRRCRIKGETEAEVRDTIFDEMKIAHRDVSAKTLTDAQKQLAYELDRRKVNNLSTDEIASLYDDVLWLRTEIFKR